MKDAITILEERAAEKAAKEATEKVTKEVTVVTAMQNMKGLMATMGWTAEQAMDAMQLSDSDREAILERI